MVVASEVIGRPGILQLADGEDDDRGRRKVATIPNVVLFVDFERWMSSERGYSAATRRVRRATIRQAHEFLIAGGRRKGLRRARRSDLVAFLGRYPHVPTRNRALSDLRAYYAYLGTDDPTTTIAALKPPRRLPRPLLHYDAVALIETARRGRLKAYVMIMLIFYTGLRRAELAGLRWEDLALAEGILRVVGKGNKERVLPLPVALVEVLRRWQGTQDLPLARAERTGSVFVFPSLYGDGRPIHPTSVNTVIAKVARAAGVSATPHRGRHSFATSLLEAGSDIRVVQELLGHASLSSTQIYTAVSAGRMRDDVARLDFSVSSKEEGHDGSFPARRGSALDWGRRAHRGDGGSVLPDRPRTVA